jgi:hypothetical protein
MKLFWLGAVAVWALVASGCVVLPTEQVSAGSELGARYVLKAELRACGIKREATDHDYEYVLLVGKPGIANRFVVQLGTVPAGTEIDVVGAVRMKVPGKSPRYVVRFVERPAWGRDEARIADQSVWSFYVRTSGSGELRLNPEFFGRVN